MKKKIYLLATVLMLALASPAVMAKNNKPLVTMTEQQKVRMEQIGRRVEEIKNMDKSTLTRQERKDLRKELLGMKKEAKAASGGVYLSVGAIIIILLILILIL